MHRTTKISVGVTAALALVIGVGMAVIGVRDSGGTDAGAGGSAASSTHSGAARADAFEAPRPDIRGRMVDVPRNGRGVPLADSAPGTVSAGDPQWLTAIPEGLRFQWTSGVPTPFSTLDGPTWVDEDTGGIGGWSHTPQGAVLAAISIQYRITSGDGTVAALAQVADDGSERYRQMQAVQYDLDGLRELRDTLALPAPAGFQIVSYSDTEAVVVIYHSSRGKPEPRATGKILRWIDGDWKLAIAPEGQDIPDRFKDPKAMIAW